MSELQPGMLALVHGLSVNTEFNGLMVELVCQPDSNRYQNFEFDGWTPGDWVCSHPSFTADDGGVTLFDRANLLPIKPEADPLDVTHKEELHA